MQLRSSGGHAHFSVVHRGSTARDQMMTMSSSTWWTAVSTLEWLRVTDTIGAGPAAGPPASMVSEGRGVHHPAR
jgi:hypothetical protein